MGLATQHLYTRIVVPFIEGAAKQIRLPIFLQGAVLANQIERLSPSTNHQAAAVASIRDLFSYGLSKVHHTCPCISLMYVVGQGSNRICQRLWVTIRTRKHYIDREC